VSSFPVRFVVYGQPAPQGSKKFVGLAKRLNEHRAPRAGATDAPTRRERFRKVILERGLAPVTLGRRNGKPETYGEYFERYYGEPIARSEVAA
jgi:hypothetical protein